MIVCICTDLKTEEVKKAIEDGCTDPFEIHEKCGECLNCGTCLAEIVRLIEEHKETNEH